MDWITAACLSALFAGITAILSKIGIKNTDSDLATAIRTTVVLAFAWAMVFVSGAYKTISSVDIKSAVFLVLSGLATGASWLCYFKALSIGEVSKVAAVDKSSATLTILFALIFFPSERSHWGVKLICLAALTIGTYLMLDINKSDDKKDFKWILFAAASAIFAAATSILAKIGVKDVDSNLATAIRTGAVLVVAYGIVLSRGKQKSIGEISRRDLGFLVLSGVATGASWLAFYYAIQKGYLSVVVPIDKLSILATVGFSVLILKEKIKPKAVAGLVLIVAATVCMSVFA